MAGSTHLSASYPQGIIFKNFFSVAIKLIALLALLLLSGENYLRWQGWPLLKHYSHSIPKIEYSHEYPTLVKKCGWLNPLHPNYFDENPRVVSTIWPSGERASRPFPLKKATRRVLLLGCSHMHGWGITDEQTLAWHLNEAFPKIRFDNFAVGGFSTYQCLMMAQAILARHPYDLVIYGAMADHLNRNVVPAIAGQLRPGYFYLRHPYISGSAQHML